MRKYFGYALIIVAVMTLVVWAVSQFVQPVLSTGINGGLILFFAALLGVTGFLAQIKDIGELLHNLLEGPKASINNTSPLARSLSTRSGFLDSITKDSNADELEGGVEDLVGFIEKLKHGPYFVGRIRELTYRPRSLIAFGDDEDDFETRTRDEEYAQQYRERLQMARQEIRTLIQELLDLEK